MNTGEQAGYSLTRYGEELVEAMPNRKAMAEVRRKWERIRKQEQKRAAATLAALEQADG